MHRRYADGCRRFGIGSSSRSIALAAPSRRLLTPGCTTDFIYRQKLSLKIAFWYKRVRSAFDSECTKNSAQPLTLSQGHAKNRSARLLRLFGSGGCRAKTMWAFDPSRTQPGVALIYFANSSAGSCRSVHLCRDSNYFQCHIRNPTRVPWQCSLSTCC